MEPKKSYERYLEKIAELRLMDDDFFSEALDGKVETVEFILQVVLEKIVDLCRIMVIRHVWEHDL